MADWSDFPEAGDDDPWAAFPEADQSRSKRGQKRRKRGHTLPASTVLDDPAAVDGDTIRAEQGRVRLAGVDAPEAKQVGWGRDGQPVPIGNQATNALGAFLGQGPAVTGNAFGSSYGRTVAPISVRNDDAGRTLLRYGNALAAPEYLAFDAPRARQYQQDERLARMNGLGMHDTLTPSPSEYRADPDYKPSGETIAQFFDTPTPLEGFRPEVEQRYLQTLANGSADEILAFVKAQGTDMREKELRQWVQWRDDERKAGRNPGVEAIYERGPEALIDAGDGVGGAIVRKGASGFLAGGLDEAGALVDTLGGTPGRESVWNSDRRLADIWANNQRQNSAILSFDQEAHPIASTAAEIGGGILGGFAIPYGQGAQTIPALAKVGGVFGGATGFLGTDGTVADRSLGAVKGSLAGALVTPALGKAVEVAAPALLAGGRRLLGKGPTAVDNVQSRGQVDAAPAGDAADQWAAFPEVGTDVPPDSDIDALLRSGAGVATVNSVLKQQGRDPIPLSEFEARKAMAMEAAPGESLSMPASRERDFIDVSASSRPRPLLDDYTSPERAAAAERVQPSDVLPVPGNMVADADEVAAIDAGRFAPAKALNEREVLDRGTVRGLNGPVPKVGPVDMVGFLRLKGGLAPDDGGELRTIGLTNAARRGLDHVGQETRFGPLVHDQGMTLDDAALMAWEAGYFPEHSTRPDVNTFLDALRGTYDGYRRRWLPEDMGQVDAYDAARQERQALDAMQADGPVSVDRSEPAGPEVPFAPPEAYDDASREAIRRVGNLDVSKLDSPQDIARALKTSHNAMGGFDAATRGAIAHAETERLAADLGMTADKLLSRRKGEAFNAEEALAARQILAKAKNELVNAAKAISGRDDPGEELLADFQRKLTRSIAIQEQVAGMTAEAGRALQQFRQVADSRAVRTDVLGSIVAAGGGKDRLRQAATALVDMVERDPDKFAPLAEKLAKPKWRDKVSELYINFLLSNPATHAVNVVSNTLTSIAQVPEFAAGAVIGGVRRAVMGEAAQDRILASEVGARAFGLLQGAKEGARMFAQALKTGEATDFVSKVEGQQYKAISGLKGEAIRIPTRFLTAEDELFKGVARRMELNAEAVRIARKEGLRGAEAKARIGELIADPTDEMLTRSMDYGRYLTFQQKLGPFAQDISNAANRHLPLKVLLPFVRTPTNLLKFATERSPAAPMLAEWRKDWVAGGDRRDMAIARMMLGSGIGYAMYQAAANGMLTGSAPADKAKARLLYADGWKPYSVKIDGTYYSYKRLDPFATTIGVAADLALLPGGMTEKQREDTATLLVASIMGNLSDKTWLSGVSDVISALHEPERYAGDFKNRLFASFLIPNVVGGTARALDPTARNAEGFGEELQSRIPWLRDDLLPKRDVWGRPIVNEGGLGPDFLSPVWLSTQLNDPVNRELMQLDYAPGVPSKKVGGRELPPAEYDRYLELAGKGSHDALSSLIRSPAWRAMDDEAKVKAARKTVAKAREDARGQLGGGDAPATDDPWDAFPKAGGRKASVPDPWDAFPVADKRDVQAELSAAIPGVRFTSGYRDPAYNASLRARGYHPSDNSEHMDGAALDMLPPPGRSLAWLRAQVQRYDPKARLLVHDGHLHGGFDGYFSAPKLGGMRGR